MGKFSVWMTPTRKAYSILPEDLENYKHKELTKCSNIRSVFIPQLISVTWLITLRGQNGSWVLGNLFYKGVKLERQGRLI
jgi:hypothetical protein